MGMYAREMFKCSHQLSCSSFLTHRWEGKKFRNSIITGEMDQIIVKWHTADNKVLRNKMNNC